MPCVGGMRAVTGPGRVSGRSSRRLGRAGCRRGGGEGSGWVAGNVIGRGTGPPAFPIGAPAATAPALGGGAAELPPPRDAPRHRGRTGAGVAVLKAGWRGHVDMSYRYIAGRYFVVKRSTTLLPYYLTTSSTTAVDCYRDY